MGLDRFEGRSWQGWDHHIALVLLACALMGLVRAESGLVVLSPLSEVASALAREHAAQDLMREHGLSHAESTRSADTAQRGVNPWYCQTGQVELSHEDLAACTLVHDLAWSSSVARDWRAGRL